MKREVVRLLHIGGTTLPYGAERIGFALYVYPPMSAAKVFDLRSGKPRFRVHGLSALRIEPADRERLLAEAYAEQKVVRKAEMNRPRNTKRI